MQPDARTTDRHHPGICRGTKGRKAALAASRPNVRRNLAGGASSMMRQAKLDAPRGRHPRRRKPSARSDGRRKTFPAQPGRVRVEADPVERRNKRPLIKHLRSDTEAHQHHYATMCDRLAHSLRRNPPWNAQDEQIEAPPRTDDAAVRAMGQRREGRPHQAGEDSTGYGS